jgi:septal ring factor EnvC (AmiA/AmiB activator)
MDRINVVLGAFVLTGEPLALWRRVDATGDGGGWAAQPVLYIELRKDETAIGPGPWSAKSDIEKARG